MRLNKSDKACIVLGYSILAITNKDLNLNYLKNEFNKIEKKYEEMFMTFENILYIKSKHAGLEVKYNPELDIYTYKYDSGEYLCIKIEQIVLFMPDPYRYDIYDLQFGTFNFRSYDIEMLCKHCLIDYSQVKNKEMKNIDIEDIKVDVIYVKALCNLILNHLTKNNERGVYMVEGYEVHPFTNYPPWLN
jgi:hypothetical protein